MHEDCSLMDTVFSPCWSELSSNTGETSNSQGCHMNKNLTDEREVMSSVVSWLNLLWCRVLEASSSSSRTVGPGVDTQGYRPYWTNTRTLTLESARCTVTAQLWWGNVRCCFSKILLNLRACLISTAWMHVFIYPVDRVDWWRVSLPEVLVLSRDFNVHRRLFVFFFTDE